MELYIYTTAHKKMLPDYYPGAFFSNNYIVEKFLAFIVVPCFVQPIKL